MLTTPWLSQEEVDDFCKPLTQAAAQIRFLRSFGLTVRTKPCGAALVMRTHFEYVMNRTGKEKRKAESSRPQPNRTAYLALVGKQA